MSQKLTLLTAVGVLCSGGAMANDFIEIVEGRVTSREWAGIVAEDLSRAFPERTGEVVTAVALEYPAGTMTAALAAAAAVPMKATDAADAVAKLVPPELSSAAMHLVLSEGGR